MPLPVMLERGTQVSRYRIEELVARGGMGLVYRATDVQLERRVALKVLTPELSEDESFRGRFVRESRLAAAVDHPHIIPVYEAGDCAVAALVIQHLRRHGVELASREGR